MGPRRYDDSVENHNKETQVLTSMNASKDRLLRTRFRNNYFSMDNLRCSLDLGTILTLLNVCCL